MSLFNCVEHFKVSVAKDLVIREFGGLANDWPDHNFWAVVSTYKQHIHNHQVPQLMKRYKVKSIPGFSSGDVNETAN